MRILKPLLCLVAVAGFGVSLAGCGAKPANDATSNDQSGHYEGDGHDHSGEEAGHFEGDGHDHANEVVHAHPTEGPHGGHLIELGNEEYHAELLHDEATHKVTIHLLDSSGKEPVRQPLPEITMQLFKDGQFVSYTLKAVPKPDTPNGAASTFEVVDAGLCDTLCHAETVKGRLQVTIAGKPYTGTIEHDSHDHEGHEGHVH